jgi:hypothetical protein
MRRREGDIKIAIKLEEIIMSPKKSKQVTGPSIVFPFIWVVIMVLKLWGQVFILNFK